MFRRLLLEDWMGVFTLIAFITALSIFLCIAWRALRMRKSQTDRLSHLPFDDEKPNRRHE